MCVCGCLCMWKPQVFLGLFLWPSYILREGLTELTHLACLVGWLALGIPPLSLMSTGMTGSCHAPAFNLHACSGDSNPGAHTTQHFSTLTSPKTSQVLYRISLVLSGACPSKHRHACTFQPCCSLTLGTQNILDLGLQE